MLKCEVHANNIETVLKQYRIHPAIFEIIGRFIVAYGLSPPFFFFFAREHNLPQQRCQLWLFEVTVAQQRDNDLVIGRNMPGAKSFVRTVILKNIGEHETPFHRAIDECTQ